MKNWKIIFTLFVALLFINVGCDEDGLDINHDPMSLEQVDNPEVLMPVAQMSVANTIMGWDMGITGGFWSQYFTQSFTASQFRQIDQYFETTFSNTYTELTAGALNDLEAMKKSALANDELGSYVVAEALSIFTWQVVTDTWGTVPYFEALKGDEGILSPNFDTGDKIYADLIARCDELINNESDYDDVLITSAKDFIYAGDIHEWFAFVKSLKLKLLLRQSETSGYNNATVLAYVDDNIDGFMANSAMVEGTDYFIDKDGSRHPMAEVELGEANYLSTNVIASKTFLSYLRVNGDPRLASIYIPGDNGQMGSFQGDFFSEADADLNGTKDQDESYSTVEFAFDDDLFIMSVWEVYFNIAEVYARAGRFVDAEEYYIAAVEASLDHHGIEDYDAVLGTEVGNEGYAVFTNGTEEELIKQIAMQRWVSYAKTQHWESFIERNRTKYPAVNDIDIAANRQQAYINFPVGDFTISVNGRAKLGGRVPASPTYPEILLTRNYSETVPGQKADVGVKIWWDQKSAK